MRLFGGLRDFMNFRSALALLTTFIVVVSSMLLRSQERVIETKALPAAEESPFSGEVLSIKKLADDLSRTNKLRRYESAELFKFVRPGPQAQEVVFQLNYGPMTGARLVFKGECPDVWGMDFPTQIRYGSLQYNVGQGRIVSTEETHGMCTLRYGQVLDPTKLSRHYGDERLSAAFFELAEKVALK